jgi:peroxiredoxin
VSGQPPELPDPPDPPDPPGPPADLTRLDPDAAAAERARPRAAPRTGRPPPPPPPSPVVDVRRYRWAIGIIGLVIVLGVSIYQFATHSPGTTGVPPGQRLHWFAAPLADTDLQGDANLRPPCTLAHHDPRALNLCLDAHRTAVVIAFFVPQSAGCVRQVDALQTLARRFPASRVTFAAVAVGASHADAARLVAAHHWTIPVAYDADGAVGDQYGVVVCPMAELATRGGIVRDRLIGNRWESIAALEPRVAALLRGDG